MLRVRHIEESDFDKIEQWLKFWHPEKVFVRDMYPDTGLMLYEEETGEDLYCGFLWMSNSKMAQIGFITRNPNVRIRNKQTLKTLIESLFLYARQLEYTYVITWVSSIHLKKSFKDIGMVELSDNVSEFITKIK